MLIASLASQNKNYHADMSSVVRVKGGENSCFAFDHKICKCNDVDDLNILLARIFIKEKIGECNAIDKAWHDELQHKSQG